MTSILFLSTLLFPIPTLVAVISHFAKLRKAVPCALLAGVAMMIVCCGLRHVAEGTLFEGDVSRYSDYVALYQGVSFWDAFQVAGSTFKSYPVTTIWFWAVSQTGYRYSLQASACFVNYSIAFYFLFDQAKKEKLSSGQITLGVVLMLSCLPLFYSTSALRSTPALILGMLAVYLEFAKRRRGVATLALYIVPCFIHSTAFLVPIARLLYQLLGKSFSKLMLCGLLSIPIVLAFSSALSGLFSIFNVNIVDMLMSYSDWTGTHADASSSALYYTAVKAVNVAFMVLLCLDNLCRSKGGTDSADDLTKFCVSMLGFLISLSLFVQADSYLRFTYAVYPLLVVPVVRSRFRSGSDKRRCGTVALSGLDCCAKAAYVLCYAALFALHAFAFLRFVQLEEIARYAFFGLAALWL